ncbi:MAG: hypothetical protein P8H65_06350 [Rhodothermales bacterium]|nr:hypothetical protein [Rhodothermales bacterium]MDG2015524.1 hypothetical protein [Rhodothermales bacterium]HAY35543.1 hypothetical protein [Bacteroidota bacterium]
MTVHTMSFYKTQICTFLTPPFTRVAYLFLLGAVLTGCAQLPIDSPNEITVEGYVSMMGNEPFAQLVLKTSDNNSYVLKMEPEMRSTLSTPANLKVSGRVYLGSWNGKPIAHLQVKEFSSLN